MAKVGIGVIGCGKIAERWVLPNLKECNRAEVTGLADIDIGLAQWMAQKFGMDKARVYRDWEEMVAWDGIDVVIISTPNYLHAPMAIASCRAKKHTLIAKPMAITLEGADEMIAAARQNKVFLMVEQTQRFEPMHEVAKQIIDSGRFGRINMVRGRIGHAGPEYWSKDSSWFYDKAKSGGGALIDGGSHVLDLILWLTGKKVAEVFASVERVKKKFKVEDNARCLLRFEDGTLGSFEASWTTRPYEILTFIYGERGKMTTAFGRRDPLIVSMADTRRGKDPNCLLRELRPKVPAQSKYKSPFHYFINCIRKGERPSVSGEESRRTLEVILAAYRSAREKRWVKIQKKGNRDPVT